MKLLRSAVARAGRRIKLVFRKKTLEERLREERELIFRECEVEHPEVSRWLLARWYATDFGRYPDPCQDEPDEMNDFSYEELFGD